MRIAIDRFLHLYFFRSDLARNHYVAQMCAFKEGINCSGYCPHLVLTEDKHAQTLTLCQGTFHKVEEVKYFDEIPTEYEDV